MSLIVDFATASYALNTTYNALRGTGKNIPSATTCSAVVIADYQADITTSPVFRGGHASVFYGGEITVFGGWSVVSNVPYPGDMWRYNPGTTTWSSRANVSNPGSFWDIAHVLNGNKLVCFGGRDDFNIFGTLKQYNLDTSVWSTLPNTGGPTAIASAAAVLNGTKMYIVCGFDQNFSLLTTVWVYDFNISSWSLDHTGTITGRQGGHAVCDGSFIYYFGGADDSFTAKGDFWKYNLGTKVWTLITTTGAPGARFWHKMAIYNGDVYVMGGTNDYYGAALNDLWKWNIATPAWTQITTATLPSARENFSFLLDGTTAYVFGGFGKYGNNSSANNDTWIADFSVSPIVFTQLAGGQVSVNSATLTYQSQTITVSVDAGNVAINVVQGITAPRGSQFRLDSIRLDLTRP